VVTLPPAFQGFYGTKVHFQDRLERNAEKETLYFVSKIIFGKAVVHTSSNTYFRKYFKTEVLVAINGS